MANIVNYIEILSIGLDDKDLNTIQNSIKVTAKQSETVLARFQGSAAHVRDSVGLQWVILDFATNEPIILTICSKGVLNSKALGQLSVPTDLLMYTTGHGVQEWKLSYGKGTPMYDMRAVVGKHMCTHAHHTCDDLW